MPELRTCKASDCSERFEPSFPRQVYHQPACRERMKAQRLEQKKVELALERANDRGPGHKDRLPSAYVEGFTHQTKFVADMRFEMDESPAAATGHVLLARVKAALEAHQDTDKNGLYAALVLIAATAGSWACRLGAPRAKRKVGGTTAGRCPAAT